MVLLSLSPSSTPFKSKISQKSTLEVYHPVVSLYANGVLWDIFRHRIFGAEYLRGHCENRWMRSTKESSPSSRSFFVAFCAFENLCMPDGWGHFSHLSIVGFVCDAMAALYDARIQFLWSIHLTPPSAQCIPIFHAFILCECSCNGDT